VSAACQPPLDAAARDGHPVREMNALRSLLQLNPWVYLVAAGFAEMGFTSFMKLSNAFSRWGYDILFAACAILSFLLLNLSTRALSLGTAYAVWTGMGAFGTAIVGILFFGDSTAPWRLFFLMTLIGSIVGLKLVS
jgi:quaternary ammonium compound-resistance protein SugE